MKPANDDLYGIDSPWIVADLTVRVHAPSDDSVAVTIGSRTYRYTIDEITTAEGEPELWREVARRAVAMIGGAR